MVQPVQSATSALSLPFQPINVNPLYKDQFGVSTLTHGLTPRKSIIVLGFLAMATMLIIFLRRLFSTDPALKEIQDWVKQNCKSLNGPHQEVLARLIAGSKEEIDNMVNPSVRAVVDACSVLNCSCSVCKNIKIYILQYFKTNGYKSNEIDTWVEQNCNHLSADDQFRVASVTESASIKMRGMVNPNVRHIVYTFFDRCFQSYLRQEDWKIVDCVLRYFRDKNKEIQTWLLRTYKDMSEEVLVQVVQRVNEIEILPVYAQDPKALIRKLRLESFVHSDPIQSKALSYLTQSRAQAYLKSKYGSGK